MPSGSAIVICAAGGGKTTRIVEQAAADDASRTLLATYTRNNVREIERKFYENGAVIPPHVEVMSWFSFLLRELARPYRRAMHGQRIEGIKFVEGRSVQFVPERKVATHYFEGGENVYSDKIAKFIVKCEQRAAGRIMRRLAARFDRIFVDEIQDMAGYDLDVLELMLKAGIKLTLVGDHRQATFKTNQSARNSTTGGVNIIEQLRAWEQAGLATLSYERLTHRCNQQIASLSDSLFPNEPSTQSLNDEATEHDGIFVVRKADLAEYVARFAPQVLRFSRSTPCGDLPAMNFGEAKGLTFNRVLIFPHGGAKKWLLTGRISHIEKSLARMYVGLTRARYSVAFAYDGAVSIQGVRIYGRD